MIKLVSYLKPYAWPVALTLALILVQTISELFLPTLMAEIVDTGIVKGDVPFILQTGLVMLGVTLIGAAGTIGASYFSSRASSGFGRDLRGKMFERVERFSLHEFDKFGTATLITRTTNDVTQVQTFVQMFLRLMVMAPIMSIGGIVMAVSKDAELSLIFVVVIPLMAGAIIFIASKGMPLFRKMQVKLDKLNLVLRESLSGIRVIRAFDRIAHKKKRFDDANEDLSTTGRRAQNVMSTTMPVIMFSMNLTTIAIIWFGGLRIDTGHIQVGDMMAFLQYGMQILFSLMMLTMMFVMFPRAAVSATRIHEVLATEPEIKDPAQPKLPDAGSPESHKGVEFRNVSFRYPGAEQPVLKGISFTAARGKVTAIIGGTGSGKSTLVGLIPRFYDVEEGAVLVDGVDVRDYTQEALRSRIGFVPQKALLFSGTVSDNIRYGKPEADDAAVRKAAEIAQSLDFVEAKPEGFGAVISQGGQNLSGGQKQRLSIARALARKPAVYVFDDSFSALDFTTDARLRAALEPEVKDAALIVVAQRVGTIMQADSIVVLEDGAVAGIGSHEALLKSCDVYREIVESQLPALVGERR